MNQALYRVSQLLNSILDLDQLLEQVMDEAIASVNAERGMLILLDERSGSPDVRVARHIEREISRELSELSRTALNEVLQKREPKLYVDAAEELPEAQSVIIGHVRSIACVPLISRERLIGAVYVDSRTDHNVLNPEALEFLSAFAGIAALAIENARLHEKLVAEGRELRAAIQEWRRFPEIIGRSPAMQSVFELMNRVIPTDVPVLIYGETGTGKELVARAIHFNGPRQHAPFVPVNCGAIPENLLESELFGHRRGSFSGAVADQRGLLDAANGGTLFLDEIADLPMVLQPKLLRVLQSGEVRAVGDTASRHVDVRIISASNQRLGELLQRRRFREDLFYRLSVMPLELPPLRQRREDIPLLVDFFLRRSAERLGRQITGIAPAALSRLQNHDWPGNIRELENAVERAVVLCDSTRVEESHVAVPESESPPAYDTGSAAEIEKRVVVERLRRFGGNRTRTAASLGISRQTLLNKLAEWRRQEEESEASDSPGGPERSVTS